MSKRGALLFLIAVFLALAMTVPSVSAFKAKGQVALSTTNLTIGLFTANTFDGGAADINAQAEDIVATVSYSENSPIPLTAGLAARTEWSISVNEAVEFLGKNIEKNSDYGDDYCTSTVLTATANPVTTTITDSQSFRAGTIVLKYDAEKRAAGQNTESPLALSQNFPIPFNYSGEQYNCENLQWMNNGYHYGGTDDTLARLAAVRIIELTNNTSDAFVSATPNEIVWVAPALTVVANAGFFSTNLAKSQTTVGCFFYSNIHRTGRVALGI